MRKRVDEYRPSSQFTGANPRLRAGGVAQDGEAGSSRALTSGPYGSLGFHRLCLCHQESEKRSPLDMRTPCQLHRVPWEAQTCTASLQRSGCT